MSISTAVTLICPMCFTPRNSPHLQVVSQAIDWCCATGNKAPDIFRFFLLYCKMTKCEAYLILELFWWEYGRKRGRKPKYFLPDLFFLLGVAYVLKLQREWLEQFAGPFDFGTFEFHAISKFKKRSYACIIFLITNGKVELHIDCYLLSAK